MRHFPFILLPLLVILVTACASPTPETVATPKTTIVEVTREVTVRAVVEVTRKVEVTRLLEVTRIVERPVTVTPTNTPLNSPTPSDTPTITPTPSNTPTPTPSLTPSPSLTSTSSPPPTATPDLGATTTIEAQGVLAAPKGNGFYTVGIDILHGKWRSNGNSVDCYWARLDANQELIDNHFGIAGGTVTIRPNDYEVEFDGCGTWEYVENETPVLLDSATDPKENGFYTVGVEIAAGQWRSDGTSDDCYWARLDANQDLLDNHFGNAGGTVTIRATDYEVEFSDCGTWEYLGP
jgi:hypothetical protein